MKQKLFALLLIITLLLAACGGEATTPASAPAPMPAPKSETVPTQEATPVPASTPVPTPTPLPGVKELRLNSGDRFEVKANTTGGKWELFIVETANPPVITTSSPRFETRITAMDPIRGEFLDGGANLFFFRVEGGKFVVSAAEGSSVWFRVPLPPGRIS